MKLNNFGHLPLIGIMRGITKKYLLETIDAAISGGLKTIEITMNTDEAASLIETAKKNFGSRINIGAGTVTNLQLAQQAVAAGADFLVAPNTSAPVLAYSQEQEVACFPGALTPTEILTAWELGAYMVKVFPVSSLGGVDYIRDLRGPYDKIKLLACGGIKPSNLVEYFAAGSNAIAIGSQIFNPVWIKNGTFDKIASSAGNFVELTNAAKITNK